MLTLPEVTDIQNENKLIEINPSRTSQGMHPTNCKLHTQGIWGNGFKKTMKKTNLSNNLSYALDPFPVSSIQIIF